MTNESWIKNQFRLFKKHKRPGSRYRDVLLVTSFIESIVREEASTGRSARLKEFKKSLQDLGLVIDTQDEKISSYSSNCQYQSDCLQEINILRVQRNELLHDIIRKNLPENHINCTIKEMAVNIELICKKSSLIRNYFVNNYRFDPAMLI